jgi:hypothetical protein
MVFQFQSICTMEIQQRSSRSLSERTTRRRLIEILQEEPPSMSMPPLAVEVAFIAEVVVLDSMLMFDDAMSMPTAALVDRVGA